MAASYGGRWDIVRAVKSLTRKVISGEIILDEVDDHVFSKELSLNGIPDPDLLIRTGGEYRISNFLLWNLAYSEMWFTDTLWPDFNEEDFDEALRHFSSRQRRFGHTSAQVDHA